MPYSEFTFAKDGSPYAIGPLSVLPCPVLSCPILSVYAVSVLWRNGWMDQDETWHGDSLVPGHYVR